MVFKAAALLQSIVAHRSLVDGNNRLGWIATAVFLDINGETVDLGDDDAFQLVLAVAEGRLDVRDIADRLITSQTGPEA